MDQKLDGGAFGVEEIKSFSHKVRIDSFVNPLCSKYKKGEFRMSTILWIVFGAAVLFGGMYAFNSDFRSGVNKFVRLGGSRTDQLANAVTTAADRNAMLKSAAEENGVKTTQELMQAGMDAQGLLDNRDSLLQEQAAWQKAYDTALAASVRLSTDGIDNLLQAKELGVLSSNGQEASDNVAKIKALLEKYAPSYADAEATIQQTVELAEQVDDETSALIMDGQFDLAATRFATAKARINEGMVRHLNSNPATKLAEEMKSQRKEAEARAKISGEFAARMPRNADIAMRQINAASGSRTMDFDAAVKAAMVKPE